MQKQLKFLTLFLWLVMLFSAFTVQAAATPNVSDYPNRHSDFDFKVAWRATPLPGGLAIDGLLKNIHWYKAENIDMTIFIIGKDNKIRSRQAVVPAPQSLKEREVAQFSAKLKTGIQQGDILQFQINYDANEGGNETTRLRSNFSVDATTGTAVFKDKISPSEW